MKQFYEKLSCTLQHGCNKPFCLGFLMAFSLLTAHAQDSTKTKTNPIARPVPSAQQLQRISEYKQYLEQAKITVQGITAQYKREADSLFSDQRTEGKTRWEKINALIIQRNRKINRITDSVRLRYARIAIKPAAL